MKLKHNNQLKTVEKIQIKHDNSVKAIDFIKQKIDGKLETLYSGFIPVLKFHVKIKVDALYTKFIHLIEQEDYKIDDLFGAYASTYGIKNTLYKRGFKCPGKQLTEIYQDGKLIVSTDDINNLPNATIQSKFDDSKEIEIKIYQEKDDNNIVVFGALTNSIEFLVIKNTDISYMAMGIDDRLVSFKFPLGFKPTKMMGTFSSYLFDSESRYPTLMSDALITDIEAINTNDVKNYDVCFAYRNNVTLPIVSIASATSTMGMMYGTKITTIPSYFYNTSIEDFSFTFGKTNITSVNNFVPTNVDCRMDGTFCGCLDLTQTPELTPIAGHGDINILGTQHMISCIGLFYGCTYITSVSPIEISSKVKDISGMFGGLERITNIPLFDTSNVEKFEHAWTRCYLLETFPLFDTSSATTLYHTWEQCGHLTTFPLINTSNVTDMRNAWTDCYSLTSIPLLNTSNVTNMDSAWSGCSKLTEFPMINTSKVTIMRFTWYNCRLLSTFPSIITTAVIDMESSWNKCNSLTTFPLIDTSKATNLNDTWRECYNLTSFPNINIGSVTTLYQTWYSCSGLTNFPLIDTSKITSFEYVWEYCSGLTSFPLIDTSNVTSMGYTWANCAGLTSFPLIDTSSVTIIAQSWVNCRSLTSFPLLNTSNVVTAGQAWSGCSGLTSFPLIDTSSADNLRDTWSGCSGLTSFPRIDTRNVENFNSTFLGCSSLTSFPTLDTSKSKAMYQTWENCTGLITLGDMTVDGIFDMSACTLFYHMVIGCTNLTDISGIKLGPKGLLNSAWNLNCSSLINPNASEITLLEQGNYTYTNPNI